MIPRFTVTRELGRGGQGRVLAVRDAARGDRELALKETTALEGTALRGEFELLARLRHPNLGAVHDWFARSPLVPAGTEPAPAAYTQDLIDGTDLYRALRQAPLAEREAAFEQVFRALAYLHALGVVHLDLKPDNILVGRSVADAPVVRVVDFGIAAPRGEQPETVRGSLSYIAPERLRGAAVDPRADLYSLGVVMAEVWVGGPLLGASAMLDPATRRAWLAERRVPESWLDLVVALTERDPARRPENVYAAASLWSRALSRSVTLQTPATVAAMLRAAAPVGRAEARDGCLASALAGHAQVIVGAPGSGRRTLATQVARRAQSAGHRAEHWPGSPDRATVADLAATLERLVGDDAGLAAATTAPMDPIETGAPGAGSRLQRAVATAMRPVAEALVALQAAARRPVLIVDRLATLPPPVDALISQLVAAAEEGAELPLGLLVVADQHPGSAAVGLEPLGRADVARLLELRLGPSLATPALASALTAASGGHPLTLENLLALLVARGELQFGPDGWTAAHSDVARSLPSEMEDAVQERVRLLDAESRGLLASVAWLRFGGAPASSEHDARRLSTWNRQRC